MLAGGGRRLSMVGLGVITSLYERAKGVVGQRQRRRRQEQKLLLLGKMAETQGGVTRVTRFTEEQLASLTGIRQDEVRDLVSDLEREKVIVRFLDTYVLVRERSGVSRG